MNTLRCNICSLEVEQRDDGSGGYEIGVNKLINAVWYAVSRYLKEKQLIEMQAGRS